MKRLSSSSFRGASWRMLYSRIARKQTHLAALFLLIFITAPLAVALQADSNNDSSDEAVTSSPATTAEPGVNISSTFELEAKPGTSTKLPGGSANTGNQTRARITVNGQVVSPPAGESSSQTVVTDNGAKFKIESRTSNSSSGDDEEDNDSSSEIDWDYESEESIEQEYEYEEDLD